jgi:hypothetical protein
MLNDNVAVITLEEADERLISPAPVLITEQQPAPVLITEQQVALGTAAALRSRPNPRRRWIEASRLLLGAFQSTRIPSTRGGPLEGHRYPKHYGFLEDACLAREMQRP